MSSSDFEELERIFHEPSRLAIVSELSGESAGMAFSDLKHSCGLTDGNLSRHLSVLEKAGVITIEKTFVGAKPRTTVFLSEQGRDEFLAYLSTLESVLKRAVQRATPEKTPKALGKKRAKPA